METYTILRAFADSWMLLGLTLFFIGVVFWAYRPGSRATHDAAAASIFRNDDRPGGPNTTDRTGSLNRKEASK